MNPYTCTWAESWDGLGEVSEVFNPEEQVENCDWWQLFFSKEDSAILKHKNEVIT